MATAPKLSKFICKVTNFSYTIKGKMKKLNTNMITSITIESDMVTNVTSKIELDMMLPRENILELIDNYQIASTKLEIQEIEMLDGKVKSKGIYINRTFDVIPSNLNAKVYRPQEGSGKSDSVSKEPMPVKLYLYIKQDIDVMRHNVSIQLTNATEADAIFAMCSNRYITPGKTIAQKPIRTKSHKSISLPLGEFTKNLKDMNEKYGLYGGSPFAFKDYEYFYILDKYISDDKITLPGVATFISIHLKKNSSEQAKDNGYLIDKKKLNDEVNYVGVPQINDLTKNMSYINHNNIIHVNPTNGTKTVKKLESTGGSKKAKQIVSTNPNIISKEKSKNIALSRSITLNFDEVPPSRFKPYKIFRFKADSSFANLNLKGKYRACYIRTQLSKTPNGAMHPSVTLVLQSVQ